MRNERFENGVCVHADIIDFDAGTFTREEYGVVVEGPRPLTADEVAMYAPAPLDPAGALATLLAVAGVVSVDDAANAVGVSAGALVAEAEGWAYGAAVNGGGL